jgi:indolepyruvate ferredoxin oxidoreductase alpha subunit
VDQVLEVEELEPILETELKALAHETGRRTPIRGKGVGRLSRYLEYDPGLVREALAAAFQIPYRRPAAVSLEGVPSLPGRPPTLCAGCPHRATYYAVKEVYGGDAIYPTDIGCYTLGFLPPIAMADFVICMGSSVSSSGGFSRATDQKVVAFIGDSTFFHSGITGLINGVHNRHRFTLVILDNGTTAMTGHQPHPGVDSGPMGLDLTRIDLEALVRGCGVQDVQVVQPFKVRKTLEAVRATLERDGISVIISREFCPLFARATGQFKKGRPFRVSREKCRNHRDCIRKLGCPAIYLEGERVEINRELCIGCSLCAQICPESAIVPLKD